MIQINRHAKTLATNIQKLVQEVEETTSGKVRIIGIESRLNPRFVTPVNYNQIRNSVNKVLKNFEWTKSRYWSMKVPESGLYGVGVHLPPETFEVYSASCKMKNWAGHNPDQRTPPKIVYYSVIVR